MIFRLYHHTKGGHVHCRLFAGPHDGALGKCGDLCMRTNEFALFKDAATFMQFREDTPKCLAMVFGGDWCVGRCRDPKDCTASPACHRGE